MVAVVEVVVVVKSSQTVHLSAARLNGQASSIALLAYIKTLVIAAS